MGLKIRQGKQKVLAKQERETLQRLSKKKRLPWYLSDILEAFLSCLFGLVAAVFFVWMLLFFLR
jgi:hypothetical protein